MEFIQFHPTALYHRATALRFLITEAMRGYGAVPMDGKEFMQKYDPRLSLLRDIVARTIDNEMKMQATTIVIGSA